MIEVKQYSVWSNTYGQTEFSGSYKECQQFIREQREKEKDFNEEREDLVIESSAQ